MSRSDLIPPSPDAFEADNTAEGDVFAHDEPFKLFEDWLAAAKAKEPNDPNAMTLATVDANGQPDARMVLLKGVDERGFVFYTNTESDKGRELAAAPKAALLFHWKSLRRQVRVRGAVEAVTVEEADAYFATARATAKSGPGRRTSRVRWRVRSRWKNVWPNTASSSAWARCPGRRTGPAIA